METVETGDKNLDVTDKIFRELCLFFEQSLGKINANHINFFFPEWVVALILSLTSVDYFRPSEYLIGQKRKKEKKEKEKKEMNLY